jgi:hypothetical protein
MAMKIVLLEEQCCPMLFCDYCGGHSSLKKKHNADSFNEPLKLPIYLLTNMKDPPDTAQAIATSFWRDTVRKNGQRIF